MKYDGKLVKILCAKCKRSREAHGNGEHVKITKKLAKFQFHPVYIGQPKDDCIQMN